MQNRTARYGPARQMVICETPEQVEVFDAAGWRDCPLDLVPPYRPDEAQWVPRIDDAILEPMPVRAAPRGRSAKG